MSYEQIKITDAMVIAGLIIALLMAIFYQQNELSMSIASGMIGYIGGSAKLTQYQDKNMGSENK